MKPLLSFIFHFVIAILAVPMLALFSLPMVYSVLLAKNRHYTHNPLRSWPVEHPFHAARTEICERRLIELRSTHPAALCQVTCISFLWVVALFPDC
jgi:hypothetical protein